MRNFDCPDALHALLSLFLFFEQLALAGDVAAVTFGENVFSDRLDRAAADNLSSDSALDGDVELLPRDKILETHADSVCILGGLFPVDDDGEGIDRFAVQENVQLDQVVRAVARRRVVQSAVTAADGFQPVVKVEHDFGERQIVFEDDFRLVDVFHVFEFAALFFAEFHQPADKILWREDLRLDVWFLDAFVAGCVRELGRA